MNGRTAKLINRIAGQSSASRRRALKRTWLATPRPKRGKLRRQIARTEKVIEEREKNLMVDDFLQRKQGR